MNRLRFCLLSAMLIAASSIVDAQMYWNSAANLGSTSYIAVRPDAVYDFQGDFTVECWVNLEDVAGAMQSILTKTRTVGSTGYRLGFTNGKLGWIGGGQALASQTAVPYGEWSHVAVTYASASRLMTIYVNGQADTSKTFPSGWAPVVNTDSLYIGYYPFTGAYGSGFLSLRGEMDDLRIWSRALSASQISRFWRMTLGSGTGSWYEGLELSYTFDKAWGGVPATLTCTDQSGNRRSGIVHRGAITYRGEQQPVTVADQVAIDLDGTGDYVAGYSTFSTSLIGSFTLECWVYPRTTQAQATLIQKREGSNPSGYTLYLDENRPAIRTATVTRLRATAALPAGEWSHVAAMYDSAKTLFSIYINGVLDTTHAEAAPPVSNGDSLYIGNGFNGGFNGYMDEVRIRRYVLTTTQVRSHMWRSIDKINRPVFGDDCVTYNFDGTLNDNSGTGGPSCVFRGGAHFTTSWYTTGVPQAPMVRADAIDFSTDFSIKHSDRKIPASLTIGSMLADSLQLSARVGTITDIELFVALNHPQPEALTITLVSPGGDSLDVFSERPLAGNACNVMTVFDDDATVSLAGSSGRLGFGPTIRPERSLRSRYVGTQGGGYWKLLITDGMVNGTGRLYGWGLRVNNTATSAGDETAHVPGEFLLGQNYPNPFNPSTTFQVNVPDRQRIVIGMFDVLGREVAVLMDEEKEAGTYTVRWDASDQASGVYLCRATAGQRSLSRKVLLLK
jgi:subtilisin-like proprotein convertase family protein